MKRKYTEQNALAWREWALSAPSFGGDAASFKTRFGLTLVDARRSARRFEIEVPEIDRLAIPREAGPRAACPFVPYARGRRATE